MHSLELHTLKIIGRDRLIPVGSTVIIGVSGGADSVGLLFVLSRLTGALSISPVAVYIDHGLRPTEVVKERNHVAALAEQLGIACEIMEINTEEYARDLKLSLEHAARDLRYQALREVVGKYNATVLATAHTADDQAEEILIRLLRGGGRKGISGMRTKEGDLVRPFLETEKKDILAYLSGEGVGFLEDSSNFDLRFLRNRVRHELIPFLEQRFDPGIKSALRKTAGNLADDEKLLEELTGEAMENILLPVRQESGELPGKLLLDRILFLELPAALQRRVIEKLLWQIGGRAEHVHILQVVAAANNGRTGSELHLNRGLRVGVQKKYLEFVYPEGERPWRGRLYP